MLSTDDLSKELDGLTKNLFEDTDTIYKKAVDANYVSDTTVYLMTHIQLEKCMKKLKMQNLMTLN